MSKYVFYIFVKNVFSLAYFSFFLCIMKLPFFNKVPHPVYSCFPAYWHSIFFYKLKAVVLRRIVRCSYVYSSIIPEFSHSKIEHWRCCKPYFYNICSLPGYAPYQRVFNCRRAISHIKPNCTSFALKKLDKSPSEPVCNIIG